MLTKAVFFFYVRTLFIRLTDDNCKRNILVCIVFLKIYSIRYFCKRCKALGIERFILKAPILHHKKGHSIFSAIDWCYDNDERFIEADDINPENSTRDFTGWTNTEQSLTSLTTSLVSKLDLQGFVFFVAHFFL